MNLTPAHLKIFRSYFALTQKQAAALIDLDKSDWLRMELEIDPVTSVVSKRVRRQTDRLKKALVRKSNWCHNCRKNVARARAKGIKTCPYCSRYLIRSMKKQIMEVI